MDSEKSEEQKKQEQIHERNVVFGVIVICILILGGIVIASFLK